MHDYHSGVLALVEAQSQKGIAQFSYETQVLCNAGPGTVAAVAGRPTLTEYTASVNNWYVNF